MTDTEKEYTIHYTNRYNLACRWLVKEHELEDKIDGLIKNGNIINFYVDEYGNKRIVESV